MKKVTIYVVSALVALVVGLGLTDTSVKIGGKTISVSDQATHWYNKTIGRVSLVCKTDGPKQAKLEFGLSPNSTYNIVVWVRRTDSPVVIERHANDYNYDESDLFTFKHQTDKYLYIDFVRRYPRPSRIAIDRYDGVLTGNNNEGNVFDGSKPTGWYVLGECKTGYLKAEKKF
jgi:hypothetical protein